jgi:hypothetical protein
MRSQLHWVPKASARFVLCLIPVTLAACGGGGDNGGNGVAPPPPNAPPTASAGASQTVLEGSMVTLSAVGSTDDDGNIALFAWTQTGGADVSLTGASSATATFTAVLTDDPVTLTFSVMVTDDDGATDEDTTTVTVNPSTPPTADAGSDQTVVEREEVLLSAAGSGDTGGSIEAYAWTQTGGPGVTLSAPDVAEPTFMAPIADSAIDLTFEVTVTNNAQASASDSVTVSVLPNQPPTLAVTYPCDGCRSWGDLLTVMGTASPGNDTPEVAVLDSVLVTVDAGAGPVPATLLAEGVWIAENVPVDTSSKTLDVTIDVTDQFGEAAQAALALEQRPTLSGGYIATDPSRADVVYLLETSNPRGRLIELQPAADEIAVIHQSDGQFTTHAVRVDPSGNRLLAATPGQGEIFGIDLTSGTVTVLSNTGIGSGPDLINPAAMALDGSTGRLIVADPDLEALIAVDLASGDRSIIADNDTVGTGSDLVEPRTVAIDDFLQRAYVAQTPAFFVYADLATGNRAPVFPLVAIPSLLSSIEYDAGRGTLVAWSSSTDDLVSVRANGGIVDLWSVPGTSGISTGNAPEARIDVMGDRYLVNDLSPNFFSGDLDALVAIDPTTGAREIVFQDTLGNGERLDDVRNVLLSPLGDITYVVSESSVVSIDLSGGHRTLVSGADRGAGAALANAVDLALDLENDRILVLDRGTGAGGLVVAIDLATGDRSPISGPATGTGSALPDATAIVLDSGNDRVLIADDTLDAIVGVDIATGNRAPFSEAADGAVPFVTPNGMELDVAGNRLIVADEGSGAAADIRIFSVDLATGARSVISDASGFGPPLTSARDVAAITGGNRLLVAAQDALMLIDGNTGERMVVSSNAVGSGESVANIAKIALDPVRSVVYGWSVNFEALFQFNMQTGDRMVVSK